MRTACRELREAQPHQVTALFRDMRMDAIEVSTDKDDYAPELICFFRHRERMPR